MRDCPPTLLRSDLVASLNARRDNDVYVWVPLESGGSAQLAIVRVDYDPDLDLIQVVTEEHHDLPEPGAGGE